MNQKRFSEQQQDIEKVCLIKDFLIMSVLEDSNAKIIKNIRFRITSSKINKNNRRTYKNKRIF